MSGERAYSGMLVGAYRLVDRLESIGPIEVWRAQRLGLARQFVVKLVPRARLGTADDLDQFQTEIRAVIRLHHPGLLPVLDCGSPGGFFCLVTPLAGGLTLDHLLGEPWPLAEATQVLDPLAAALDYAHSRRLVHGNLQPASVFIGDEGQVLLDGLGLTNLLEHVAPHTSGQPGYRSPEQRRGSPPTAASDRYAFGRIAFELLTGRPPFEVETWPSEIEPRAAGVSLPPSTLTGLLPLPMIEVLHRALAAVPEQRFPSSIGLVRALEFASAPRPAAAQNVTTPAKDSALEPPAVLSTLGTTSLREEPDQLRRSWRRWLTRRTLAGAAVVALVASLLQVFVLQPTIAQLAGRGDHAAVALARGDLLIAGGCSNKPSTGSLAALIRQIRPARSRSGDSGWLDSALVYSPAHNTWSGAGRLTQARCPVQALALPDGEVLVLSEAGTSEQPAVTAERYSPANGAWSAAGKLLIARREFAATLLASGQLLVIGGTSPTGGGDAISSVERYDPKTNNWSLAAGLTQGRRMHTATLLASGQVLVVGGLSSTGPLGTVERYDPRTNAWSPIAPLQQPRAQHTATLLADGHLLVAGGVGSGLSERSRLGTVERYDPSTNVWSRASGLSQARAGHTAGLSPAGEVLVVGGSGQTGDPPTLERFNPSNNRWTAGPPLPRPRVSHSTTILPGGQVLVVGGRASASDLSLLNTVDMYDPTTDRWRPAADLVP